jgi:shikimate kinase
MNLILFGFKGSGKSHFGKLLAQKTQRPFLDTDELLSKLYYQETHTHLSSNQIHQKIGAASFRALEKKVVFSLKGVKDTIIALGGGAILDPDSAAFLQTLGSLVYLSASDETLKTRILKEELPDFFDKNDPLGSFHRMIQERLPIYTSIPAQKIDVDALDEAGVLASLQSILILEEPTNGF